MFYPIENLAVDTHRSQTVVKKAMAQLQQHELIRRQRPGKVNKIFVCIADRQTECRPSQGRNSDHQTGGKPTANKNHKNQNYRSNRSYDYEEEDSL